MSRKAKKQASSMSFLLSRWFGRISTARPSTFIISVVVIGVALFLICGGLYDLANGPLIYAYVNNQFYFILTRSLGGSVGDQFQSETAITLVLYAFGLTGLMSVYQSTKHAYNPRQANIMLIVGVALIFLAYAFLEAVMRVKFA